MRRPIVLGNWKMNGNIEESTSLLDELAKNWTGVHKAEVGVCPSYPYLALAVERLSHTNIGVGSQDLSENKAGAFTGQVSASMLLDFGCKYVLVGHSERRQYQKESSELVAKKYQAALDSGLTPVLCVGESLSDREQGKTYDVVGGQLHAVINSCGLSGIAKGVVAYEPIWAIGTGVSASAAMAQDVHGYIRDVLGPEGEHTSLLYGGSVNAENAAELFSQPDIDGALVGGASLKAANFLDICKAAD